MEARREHEVAEAYDKGRQVGETTYSPEEFDKKWKVLALIIPRTMWEEIVKRSSKHTVRDLGHYHKEVTHLTSDWVIGAIEKKLNTEL